jgi:hypothetical protein
MTSRCIKCHRPLKHASASGYGPVCVKTVAPIQSCERDLFGFDIEKAASAALQRVQIGIESMAVEAIAVIRAGFRAARVRHGVWAS